MRKSYIKPEFEKIKLTADKDILEASFDQEGSFEDQLPENPDQDF